jgi:hypothetical protein
MAMRRAELYIMNVKRKALVPDAQGNVRNTRKHAKRKEAGGGGGDVEQIRGEKKDTHPAPSRENVLQCCGANRGVTTPPPCSVQADPCTVAGTCGVTYPPSPALCDMHLCTLAGKREEIRPPSPPRLFPIMGVGRMCVTLCRMLSP